MDDGHASLAAVGALGPEGAGVVVLLHKVSTFATRANAGRLLAFDEKAGLAQAGLPSDKACGARWDALTLSRRGGPAGENMRRR
jgi:hypothetical protein